VYALAQGVWGRGLGTELARAVTGHGFTALELPEVYATVAAPNTASLAVLGKLGFRHVRDVPGEDGGPVTRVLVCAGP
jgi:RimJ/RimL family protein N-acetyltransferase